MVRSAQDARRESLEQVEPLAPRSGRGQRGQRVDDRKREALQMSEVRDLALERGGAWRLPFLRDDLVPLLRQLALEPREPALPTVAAADDRRLDQVLLPFPRGAERAVDGRRVRRSLARARPRRRRDVEDRELPHAGRREGLLFRRHPDPFGRRRPAALVRIGHLREGQVLREALRREALRATREQREERTPSRIGPPGPAREVGRDLRATERGLEVRGVELRRANQDRDLVEADLRFARRIQRATCNLHALARLAGRGEEAHAGILGGRLARLLREEVTA
jgi:hypothetical protein